MAFADSTYGELGAHVVFDSCARPADYALHQDTVRQSRRGKVTEAGFEEHVKEPKMSWRRWR